MSGKRNASEAAADEPESKVAKLVDDPKPEADPGAKPAADGAAPVAPAGDSTAKDKAQAEPGGGEGAAADRPDANADEQGDGDDVEVTVRRSLTRDADVSEARGGRRSVVRERRRREEGSAATETNWKIASSFRRLGQLSSPADGLRRVMGTAFPSRRVSSRVALPRLAPRID